MIKTFIICNPIKERFRYFNLVKQIKENSINFHKCQIFNYIWGDQITPEVRSKYCKSDYSMRFHNRNMKQNPLTNGEISLFINHIECLRKIRKEYTSGNFLILESDVIFCKDFNFYFEKVLDSCKNINDWDIINIGYGTRYFLIKKKGYPKSEPIILNDLKFYKEDINCCIEGLIWNYKSICKFLDYFEKDEDIDSPFDTKIDIYSQIKKEFNIYWCCPCLVKQGSMLTKSSLFKSTIH